MFGTIHWLPITAGPPELTGNLQWYVNYNAMSLALVTTWTADFNEDGKVKFSRHVPRPGGIVQFNTLIPEPSTAILFATGGFMSLLLHRNPVVYKPCALITL